MSIRKLDFIRAWLAAKHHENHADSAHWNCFIRKVRAKPETYHVL